MRQFFIKSLSILIALIVITVLFVADILIFHSIIISHYGGMPVTNSLIFALFCLVLTTAFFSNSILRFIVNKALLPKTLYLLGYSTIIAFLFVVSTEIILQYFSTGRVVLDFFAKLLVSGIFYSCIIGITVQQLFLAKTLKKTEKESSKIVLILQMLSIPIIAVSINTLANLERFSKSYAAIPEAQMVIIPQNLERDHIRIVYNEKGGTVAPIKDDTLVFIIPQNGLLILQNKMAPNSNGRNYYEINTKGERTKINKSSYHISHGYNTRDGGYSFHYSPKNGISKPEGMEYENLFVDIDSVNEDLFFERYKLQSEGFEYLQYIKPNYEADLLTEFRNRETILFDSITTYSVLQCREK